jgi:transcriptional regulator with XRE-family HTH domain
VGRRVRDARMARGWTAKDLAARCAAVGAPEITTAVIANIETGRRDNEGRRRRDVTVDELLTLGYAFDTSPAGLLGTGDWEKERIAITAADSELAAADVAAWVAGQAPTPVRGLLGGGLARCASCGSELWLQRWSAGENAFTRYHCINPECPDPAACRADHLDAYVTGRVLRMLSRLADDDELAGLDVTYPRWEGLPLPVRQDVLRALLDEVTVRPAPRWEQGFDPESVLITLAGELAESDSSEAGA